MGYSLTVYDNKGKEIDFLAQKDNLKYYIQVAYSVAEDKAYEREFKAFNGVSQIDKKSSSQWMILIIRQAMYNILNLRISYS